MQNFIVILIVAVIVGLASRYIYKEKKRGVKCIGCPDSVSVPEAIPDVPACAETVAAMTQNK